MLFLVMQTLKAYQNFTNVVFNIIGVINFLLANPQMKKMKAWRFFLSQFANGYNAQMTCAFSYYSKTCK